MNTVDMTVEFIFILKFYVNNNSVIEANMETNRIIEYKRHSI